VLKDQYFASVKIPLLSAAALATVWLAGCLQTAYDIGSKDPPSAYDAIRSADLQPRGPQTMPNFGSGGAAQPAAASYFGSPVEAVVKASPSGSDGGEGFALNFDNTPVATVAKVVLGDILNVGYVIDPRAQGTISLSSGRPVAKSDMLFVLENALRVNNLVLIRDVTGYRIVPANDGAIGSVDRASSDGDAEPGYGLTVIPLQYVSGTTLVKLMEGFASKPGTIRTDPSGKLLLVLGSGSERQTAIDTVRNFDVDWLRGQSVGIYPLSNGAAAPMVTDLEKIMDSGESGLSHNLVKFQALDRQNAILVVASKPELLRMASTWISRLDRSAIASTGVKVYHVKYGDARQIAAVLSSIFTGGGNANLESAANQIAPSSGTTTLSTIDRLTGGPAPSGNAPAGTDQGQGHQGEGVEAASAISTAGALGSAGGGGQGGSEGSLGGPGGGAPLPGVRITADVANNSVLVYANEQDYQIIERALSQLDRPKLQVGIDVTIAEVTLNHDLSYGVQFFLTNNGHGSVSNTTGTVLPIIAPSVPGFNFVAGGLTTPKVILSALNQYTDVKILSNPSLVVVDNQPATLEVGDQVPVTTGSATVLSANNAVVNTVDYKNTGIILHILPRVNSNGSVLLNIEQEISAVVNNVTGVVSATNNSLNNTALTSLANNSTPSETTNLTPTISVRRVKSELSVPNGQTVLLAGLIQDTQNTTHQGLPILDQIPVLGKAFGSNDTSIVRTELILFIRPQIIQNGSDASVVAEELRSKMRGGKIGSLGGLPNFFEAQPNRTLQ
jgi:general secretion pathway protein D